MKDLILLVQLGSPISPKIKEVRAYLKEFLKDPRVVDLPRLLWYPILYLFILTTRPRKSAQAYARIWRPHEGGFPLVYWTKRFAEKVQNHLAVGSNTAVDFAFVLGERKIARVLGKWLESPGKLRKILVIPLFPQFSESTTSSVWDGVVKELGKYSNTPRFEFLDHFSRARIFIDCMGEKLIRAILQKGEMSAPVLVSFHGLPLRRITQKKDRYYEHCVSTFFYLQNYLAQKLPDYKGQLHLCFQSRFGSEKWLGPPTNELGIDLAQMGHKTIFALCPSFVSDCLETEDEIGTELAHELKGLGTQLIFVPCLNDDQLWSEGFANYCLAQLEEKKTEIEDLDYPLLESKMMESYMDKLKEQEEQNPPIGDEAKKVLKIIFFILFLDLVGFSLIFPLFPQMLDFYLQNDSGNGLLMAMNNLAQNLAQGEEHHRIVLFGGFLGAFYGLLQFVAAPIWGVLSDRWGRRPILIISLMGLALSYGLWFFASSFSWLVGSRIIGGIMAGNITTASAVVADVTQVHNRARGMAYIGVAFALGFILGPAIGGMSSAVDLRTLPYFNIFSGINPFSLTALIGLLLSLFSFFLVVFKFKETRDGSGNNRETQRSMIPLSRWGNIPWPGVKRTILSHFFFLAIFSGMEFTLTFLAHERFSFTPMSNAMMFIFVGVILAMVQGGYVRRKGHEIGERKLALRGLALVVPGLICMAWAKSVGTLYLGLFFLALGSGMAIPGYTSLVSLLTPSERQGLGLGLFRSLGALARVVGPLTAALVYWRFGSMIPYLGGALALVVPAWVLLGVRAK